MDAYEVAGKVQKYWAALYPKNSGEMPKSRKKIRVMVNTDFGLREVVGVVIRDDDYIELQLDTE